MISKDRNKEIIRLLVDEIVKLNNDNYFPEEILDNIGCQTHEILSLDYDPRVLIYPPFVNEGCSYIYHDGTWTKTKIINGQPVTVNISPDLYLFTLADHLAKSYV